MDYLKNLDKNKRDQKLYILNQLDKPIDNNIIGNFDSENSEYKRVIGSYESYIEFMQMELNQIEQFQQTGYYQTESSLTWERDITILNKFKESEIGRKWLELEYHNQSNPNPQKIIESCKPYIEGLLEIGKNFYPKHTHLLQIGNSLNRLTIEYSKLKKWDEVIYWCRLFFDLPKQYRNSNSKELRKRLDKAIVNFVLS